MRVARVSISKRKRPNVVWVAWLFSSGSVEGAKINNRKIGKVNRLHTRIEPFRSCFGLSALYWYGCILYSLHSAQRNFCPVSVFTFLYLYPVQRYVWKVSRKPRLLQFLSFMWHICTHLCVQQKMFTYIIV